MNVNIDEKKKKLEKKEIIEVLQKNIQYLIGIDQPDKKLIIGMWFHLKDLLEILQRVGKKKYVGYEREIHRYIKRLRESEDGQKKS